MLDLDFNYKKIINLVIIGIIFFGVFFLINPKKTQAVETIICQDVQEYKKLQTSKSGCGNGYYALTPNWSKPPWQVKDKSDTQKDVILNWESPKAPSNTTGEFVIKYDSLPILNANLPGVEAVWQFDSYEVYVWGPNNAFDSEKKLTNTATSGNKHSYTYPATLVNKDSNIFKFKILAHYKFKNVKPLNNEIITYLRSVIPQVSTVEALNNIAQDAVANVIQNDLYIFSTEENVDINNPSNIITGDYTPKITAATSNYNNEKKVGSVNLTWSASQVTQQGKAEVTSYEIYRRRADTNQQTLPISGAKLSTDNNKCTTNCKAFEEKAIANLKEGTTVTYEYFIKANYKEGTNSPNSGFSNYGWKVTFTADKEGKVTTTNEEGTTPFSPSDIAGNQPISGGDTPIESAPTRCEKEYCNNPESEMSKFPQKFVCQAICWINEGVMNLIKWAFELLKSAISTNTNSPYNPKFKEAVENAIGGSGATGGGGTGTTGTTGTGSGAGIGTGGTTGTGTTGTPDPGTTPIPDTTTTTVDETQKCLNDCAANYLAESYNCETANPITTGCETAAKAQRDACQNRCYGIYEGGTL